MIINAVLVIVIAIWQSTPSLTFYCLTDYNTAIVDAMNLDAVFNKRPESKRIGDMWPKTRALISQFYRPFNQELARILSDNNFLWK